MNAVVPCDCAVARADRTGARSAAVISLSQPQPIEKLHTAPGNCRSVDLQHLADLLVPAVTLHGRSGVDDDLLRIGSDGVGDLEIHRRLAVRFAGVAADQQSG